MGMVHEGNPHVNYEEALRVLLKRNNTTTQQLYIYVDDCEDCKEIVRKAAEEVKRLDKIKKRQDMGKLVAFAGFALIITGLACDSLTSYSSNTLFISLAGVVIMIAGLVILPKKVKVKA